MKSCSSPPVDSLVRGGKRYKTSHYTGARAARTVTGDQQRGGGWRTPKVIGFCSIRVEKGFAALPAVEYPLSQQFRRQQGASQTPWPDAATD